MDLRVDTKLEMEEMGYQSRYEITFIIVAIIALIIVICGILSWSFGNVWSRLCGNVLVQEVYSPDKQYKAIVFERDCGATTDFSTQVSILESTKELSNVPGNIFAMNGHPDNTEVQVEWENDHTIQITYTDGYDVYDQIDTFQDSSRIINIEYQPLSNK